MKLMIAVGARSDLLKVVSILEAIEAYNALSAEWGEPIHYCLACADPRCDAQMAELLPRRLGIPDSDPHQPLAAATRAIRMAQTAAEFEGWCREFNPHWVLMVGELDPALDCPQVAASLGIKLARIAGQLPGLDPALSRLTAPGSNGAPAADLVLAPCEEVLEDLRSAGVEEHRLEPVGNEAMCLLLRDVPQTQAARVLKDLRLAKEHYTLVVLRHAVDGANEAALRRLTGDLQRLGERMPVVFPIHTGARRRLADLGLPEGMDGGVRPLEPMDYLRTRCLALNARLVITDWLALAEEMSCCVVPCLTVVAEAELSRRATVGANRLTTLERLSADLAQILAWEQPCTRLPAFWDGQTGERVVEALLRRHTG